MKSFITYFMFTVSLCLAQVHVYSQSSEIDTLLVGTWKGTSICQVKNSPCHDEVVVYHIYKKTGVDSFYTQANKIVNGVEEDMGVIPFAYDVKKKQLISEAYKGKWVFEVKADKLKGNLVFKDQLYRLIELTKQK